jgi:hypothetical protein
MYSHCICSPKTGIMLFVNQRGYVHSEPTVVIRTVVDVVDIAARRQRFRAASLLPRKISANGGTGGGADETFRVAIAVAARSRQCSGSIVLRRCASHGHCSRWWSSSFPRNRPSLANRRHHRPRPPPKPKRTPIPDRDSRPRRATYDDDSGPASIHASGLSSSWAQRRGRPASIYPLPSSAPRQNRRRDLCNVRRPLEVACVRTSVLPSFYALFDFSPSGSR